MSANRNIMGVVFLGDPPFCVVSGFPSNSPNKNALKKQSSITPSIRVPQKQTHPYVFFKAAWGVAFLQVTLDLQPATNPWVNWPERFEPVDLDPFDHLGCLSFFLFSVLYPCKSDGISESCSAGLSSKTVSGSQTHLGFWVKSKTQLRVPLKRWVKVWVSGLHVQKLGLALL